MEIANETVPEDQITELLNTIMEQLTQQSKSEVSFTDFRGLLDEYHNEFNYASLNFEGTTLNQRCLQNKNKVSALLTVSIF